MNTIKLIEAYEIAKKRGCRNLSNMSLQAFDLSAFAKVGYPHFVNSENDLWRFHDVMQEKRINSIFTEKFHDGIPIIYCEIFLKVIKIIKRFGESIKKPIRVRLNAGQNCALISVYNLFVIDCVISAFDLSETDPILEVGPGSGYLSLLNIMRGRSVHLIEASQGFYLYQNYLFNFYNKLHPAGKNYHEHYYWWDAADINKLLPKTRIVVANHMLAEMHNYALRIILAKLVNASKDSLQDCFLIAEGLGSNVVNRHEDVFQTIQDFGFNTYPFGKNCWLFIFSLKNKDELKNNLNRFEFLLEGGHNKVPITDVKKLLFNIDNTTNPDELVYDFIRLTH